MEGREGRKRGEWELVVVIRVWGIRNKDREI